MTIGRGDGIEVIGDLGGVTATGEVIAAATNAADAAAVEETDFVFDKSSCKKSED
jgi:ATP phosphoribosyltransferase regulatory subunit HisZ